MSNFKIGDIVSTNPHPYFKDLSNIKIAGDPINIIPLMVVVEIFKETLTSYNEDTGIAITQKGNGKCKCIWFSLKTNVFNEAWFDFGALKIIEEFSDQSFVYSNNDFDYKNKLSKEYLNKSVLFKTSHLELGKIKETKLFDFSQNRISEYNSLLNFVSPPLQIIDIKFLDEKVSNRYDSKTGSERKIFSKILLKCRYYNASADKWSEIFLPIESLIKIENVESDLAIIEKDKIDEKAYLYDYTQEINYNALDKESTTILQLFDITYINGLYSLKSFDLIHQEWKVLEIPLQGIVSIIENSKIYSKESFPNFAFKKGNKSSDIDKLLEEFVEYINENEDTAQYLLITYLNKSQKVTQRVVRDFFVVPGSTKKANTYLHGFCCKKREERSFNFLNIQSIRALSISKTH